MWSDILWSLRWSIRTLELAALATLLSVGVLFWTGHRAEAIALTGLIVDNITVFELLRG